MEIALYGIYTLVVFVSEILLVRFLIRQQLVRKYRTPALSMKYSLYLIDFTFGSWLWKLVVTSTPFTSSCIVSVVSMPVSRNANTHCFH